jgi:hypothetical protein
MNLLELGLRVRERRVAVDLSQERVSYKTAVLRAQFDAIDALKYRPTFDEAARRATEFLVALRCT